MMKLAQGAPGEKGAWGAELAIQGEACEGGEAIGAEVVAGIRVQGGRWKTWRLGIGDLEEASGWQTEVGCARPGGKRPPIPLPPHAPRGHAPR